MSRLHSQKRLLGRLSRGRSSTRLLRGVAERASRASWSPGSSRRSCGRAVVRSCGRPMDLRWRRLDGPADAAEALTTTRSRPMRSAAAGGGLDSPALLGALFLNRCDSAKARLARSS